MVQAKDFSRFPPNSLDTRYTGRRVRVTGTIVDRDRKPEIVIEDPANLKLAESREERQERVDARIESQERALERFEQMLARVEALIDRLTEAQDRMDAAVEALEAQSQALMIAAATPPVVQFPMPEGPAGPAPRPGWEVMRSVKRGMSAGDVRRLIGDPIERDSGRQRLDHLALRGRPQRGVRRPRSRPVAGRDSRGRRAAPTGRAPGPARRASAGSRPPNPAGRVD